MDTQVLDFIDMLRAMPPVGNGEGEMYITFDTTSSQTYMPRWLRENYPSEMTVALQYAYELRVLERQFELVLQFNDEPEEFLIPYSAVLKVGLVSLPENMPEEKAVQNNKNVIRFNRDARK